MYSPIIGFGTGRCGTNSLARLLVQQPGVSAVHEYCTFSWDFDEGEFYTKLIDLSTVANPEKINNPSLFMELAEEVKKGNYDIHDGIRELYKQEKRVADVSFAWLNYLDRMVEIFPDLRAVCLIRDKESVVKSWLGIARENYWEVGNDRDYFPHYDLPIDEAVGQYWADYNLRAYKLCSKHEHFDMYPTEVLNSEDMQYRILERCGIEKPVLDVGVRVGKTIGFKDGYAIMTGYKFG